MQDRLAAPGTCWLATTDADGALHFAAGASTRKARNLARGPSRAVTTAVPAIDLTVEGSAAVERDADTLARAAAVYATKYDWPVDIRDGAFHAAGAPTAGNTLYGLYRLTPIRVYSIGTAECWRF